MTITRAILSKSEKPKKEFKVVLYEGNDKKKTLHFGSNMESYPDHKDLQRKESYIARHKPRENWEKSGIKTAGWWSFWLNWNLPTRRASIRDIERRFGVKIIDER